MLCSISWHNATNLLPVFFDKICARSRRVHATLRKSRGNGPSAFDISMKLKSRVVLAAAFDSALVFSDTGGAVPPLPEAAALITISFSYPLQNLLELCSSFRRLTMDCLPKRNKDKCCTIYKATICVGKLFQQAEAATHNEIFAQMQAVIGKSFCGPPPSRIQGLWRSFPNSGVKYVCRYFTILYTLLEPNSCQPTGS